MPASHHHRCPRCRAELPGDAPEGLCPACLLRAALDDSTPTRAADADPPAPGVRIRYLGDYELLEEIGRGGMGVIYKARQVSLDRIVAVKLVRAGHLASEGERERFRREARALARLRHPHIVTIHEVGEYEGQPYFSMDYVAGRDLSRLLADGPLHPTAAAGLVRTIAEAVDFAHREGTLHRDLKPSNVLIDAAGQPRITDFGLAKRLDNEASLTRSGDMLGTPGYMPPEQIGRSAGAPGPANDVYSLGAIFYEMVTGHRPFEGADSLDVAMKALRDEPSSPRVHQPELDRDVETICLKCLEKDPQRRYPSAGELAEDLGRLLRREPLLARPVSWPVRAWRWCRRNPWPTAAGVALLLLAVVAGASAWTLRQRLWSSLVDQARLERLAGRRASSLDRLAAAARIRRTPELRQEAVQTLILPGAELVHDVHVEQVDHLALSPDGRRLAVGGVYDAEVTGPENLWAGWGWTQQVRVWDLDSGEVLNDVTADRSFNMKHPSFTFLPEAPLLLLSRTAFDPELAKPPRPRSTVVRADREEAVVWNVESGAEVRTVRLEEPHMGRFEMGHWIVSPSGERAARRDLAHLLEIWDLRAGRADQVLEIAVPLAFYSERQLLLYEREALVLWDVETSTGTPLGPRPLMWSADGRIVVLPEESGVAVVRLPEGETVRRLPLEGHRPWAPESARPRLLLSPQGRRLAVLDDPEESDAPGLTLWDAANGDPDDVRPLSRIALEPGHGVSLHQSEFNAGGTYLATTGTLGTNGYLKVWDVETGVELVRLDGHHSPVWSADGRRLATIGPHQVAPSADSGTPAAGRRRGWSAAAVWEVTSPAAYVLSGQVAHLTFRGDGSGLATNGMLWHVEGSSGARRLRRTPAPHGDWLYFYADGARMLCAEVVYPDRSSQVPDRFGRVVVRFDDGREHVLRHGWPEDLETAEEHSSRGLSAHAPALSRDGRFLAVAGSYAMYFQDITKNATLGHYLDVWDLETDPPTRVWARSSQRDFRPLRFTPENLLMTSDRSAEPSTLAFHEAATGATVRTLQLGESFHELELAAGGELLLRGGRSGLVELVELATSRTIASWRLPERVLRELAASADRRFVAAGLDDGTIRLWDVATGRERLRWPAHVGAVTALTFDPEGETLVSGGTDGRVRLWHLPSLRRGLAELGLDWKDP